MTHVKALTVYVKAYRVAMAFFDISRTFPVEERYALTSQGCRSSRSGCHTLREAWAKRGGEAHFVSRLSDCMGENWETDTATDSERDRGYINKEEHSPLLSRNAEVGNMLRAMHEHPLKCPTLNPRK